MRFFSTIFLALFTICAVAVSHCKTVQEYIDEAHQYEKVGNLERATEMMRKAVEEYPEDANAHAFLGLYLGQSAGEATDFQLQAALAFESFEVLDTAVSLDSANVYARFYRGLMGIKVPEFLGKRDQSIEDLKVVLRIYEEEPEEVPEEILLSTYSFLAEVYEERDETQEAIATWKKVIELAPESRIAEKAKEAVAELSLGEPKRKEIDERGDVGVGLKVKLSTQIE